MFLLQFPAVFSPVVIVCVLLCFCAAAAMEVLTSDDGGHLIHTTQHYTYIDESEWQWYQRLPHGSLFILSYAFSPTDTIDYLTPTEIRTAFERSFKRWSLVIPVMFKEDPDYADIKIGFYSGERLDCGRPFDQVLGTVACASLMEGFIHFDKTERWAVDFEKERSKVAVDLESIAMHEIGHVLGLGHTTVKNAIMFHKLGPRRKKVDLQADDVEAVRAMYGSNPYMDLTAFPLPAPAPENSSALTFFKLINFRLSILLLLLLIRS